MRRITALMFLMAAAASQGCGSCGSKAGFTLAYHLPPTISQSAIVGPSVTTYGAQGLATGPVAGAVGVYSADASPLALRAVERAPCQERYIERAPVPRQLAPSDDCVSLQDVCRRLDKLTLSLEQLPRALGQKAKPMPDPED